LAIPKHRQAQDHSQNARGYMPAAVQDLAFRASFDEKAFILLKK